jgi:hypothetical protein
MAVNCWVAPGATVGFVGVTDMEVRPAEVTVRSVFPEMV